MNGHKPTIDDLFAPLVDRYRPTSADRQRLLEKVRASIAAGEASAQAATSAPERSGTGRRELSFQLIRRIGWVGSGALVLAGIGLTLSASNESTAPSPPPPRSLPAIAQPASEAAPVPLNGNGVGSHMDDLGPSIDVAALPSATTRAEPVGAPSNKAPKEPSAIVSKTDALERETGLWRRANRARSEGQWAESLRLLDQHAQEFPRGVLADERAVERIVVLCHMGRSEEATRDATAFLSSHPRSLLRGRVESSCGGASTARSSPAPSARSSEEAP